MRCFHGMNFRRKNGGIIRPTGIFFLVETCWTNSSGGFEGSETFFEKTFFTSISLHFPFHLLSSFSSCLFFSLASLSSSSCLFSCLSSLLSLLYSLVFRLFSCLVSPLSSSLVFLSCVVLSCLLCLSLSLSLSLLCRLLFSVPVFFLCLCLCLRVLLCVVLCGVCRCGRGVVGGRGVCLVCVYVGVCVRLCVAAR